MFEVEVFVRLKKGITDPEGATTLKSLHLLGFDNVKEIKTTKTYHITMDEKDKKTVMEKTEEMCQKLLTNPVIHSYSINIKKIKG